MQYSTVKGRNEKRTRMRFAICPSCQEYVNLSFHQCYIQPLKQAKKKKKKKDDKKRKASELDETEPPPPLYVFYDIEATQNTGDHVTNLLCAELGIIR